MFRMKTDEERKKEEKKIWLNKRQRNTHLCIINQEPLNSNTNYLTCFQFVNNLYIFIHRYLKRVCKLPIICNIRLIFKAAAYK